MYSTIRHNVTVFFSSSTVLGINTTGQHCVAICFPPNALQIWSAQCDLLQPCVSPKSGFRNKPPCATMYGSEFPLNQLLITALCDTVWQYISCESTFMYGHHFATLYGSGLSLNQFLGMNRTVCNLYISMFPLSAFKCKHCCAISHGGVFLLCAAVYFLWDSF